MEEQYFGVESRRSPSGGSRLAQPPKKPKKRPQKQRRNPLLTIGKIFYILLTVISAIIVVGYLAFTLLVPEPEVVEPDPVPEIPVVQPENPTVEDPVQTEGPQREPLVRREGVFNILVAGTDFEGVRTDTMIVASYDTKAQTVGLVSVPRDTLVERGKGENPRLVYGKGGLSTRREEISDLLGIPIDYYVKVDLTGFIALVNQVGGVDFYVPCDMNYDDPYQNLSIHYTKGMQHLNGQQAMEVARFRQNNPDENGNVTGYWDTGRTETQQKLLIALGKKVLSLGSLTKINGFVEIFNDYVKTDLKLSDMLYFASQAIYIDTAAGIQTATLQGDGNATYRGVPYCYALDPQSTLDTVNALLNPYTRDLELDELHIVIP